MQRIIATVLFSGALIAVAPAVVLAEAIPKKGATSYVTHFVFHPLSSIDVPGAGKATSLEAVGPTENMKLTVSGQRTPARQVARFLPRNAGKASSTALRLCSSLW